MKEIKSLQKKVENKQPSNLEAEQALLGSVLVNNDIIDEVSTIVNSSIFYDPAHIKIYEVIENLNTIQTRYFGEILENINAILMWYKIVIARFW